MKRKKITIVGAGNVGASAANWIVSKDLGDVILVDIQDIGLRAYTYIYTMAMVMNAAAENNKHVIILDRPNPLHIPGPHLPAAHCIRA